MRMRKIMIAISVMVAVLAANVVSAETQTVVIKNGNTLTTYTLTLYEGGARPDITTNTTTGVDVATLKGLDIPAEAWPIFANTDKTIFSSEAFRLSKENTRVQADLKNVNDDLAATAERSDNYKSGMWFAIFAAAITILILSLNLASKSKALKRARAAR